MGGGCLTPLPGRFTPGKYNILEFLNRCQKGFQVTKESSKNYDGGEFQKFVQTNLKKLKILTVPAQHILSLVTFV
jgi:hypothetical protein